MYLNVRQDYGTHTFDFWGHTESGKLTLGSGLFLGSTGIASDHHFNPREGLENFVYGGGDYLIEVFATVVGRPKPEKLTGIDVHSSKPTSRGACPDPDACTVSLLECQNQKL